MCSGQGSQLYNMGHELYTSLPLFRRTMDLCDEILYPMLGLRLAEVIYNPGKRLDEPFDRLLYTNPAIVGLQYSVAQLLMEQDRKPDMVLGYSLGEVSAAILSGAMTLESGLAFAVKLAELIEHNAPSGAMITVLSDPRILHEHPEWFAGTELAGRNFSGHFVLSGSSDAVCSAESNLMAAGISIFRLPVLFPFHSSMLKPLTLGFVRLWEETPRTVATIDMMSATDGLITRELDGSHLWNTFCGAVDFQGTLEKLMLNGTGHFIDLGPSGTLATFIKYGMTDDRGLAYSMTVTPYGNALAAIEGLVVSSLSG